MMLKLLTLMILNFDLYFEVNKNYIKIHAVREYQIFCLNSHLYIFINFRVNREMRKEMLEINIYG